MISKEDCVAMCGLEPAEIAAVSEHEHLPETAAAALARHLLNQAGGAAEIRRMIVDDIHLALDQGRVGHAGDLFAALRHFIRDNPEATAL